MIVASDETVVAQRCRRRRPFAAVAHRRPQRELRSGIRAAVADGRRHDHQIGRPFRLRHGDPHPHRTVVRRVGVVRHRVHARPVVVRARLRRRRQLHRRADAPRYAKPRDRFPAHLRIRRRDGRVRRPVVAQRGRRRRSAACVPGRRRQREPRAGGRSAVAYRSQCRHQVRMAPRRRSGGLHRDANGRRAVVPLVRLTRHGVHARSVIVRSARVRRGQVHRLAAAGRDGELRDHVRAHFRVGRRDRRVVRQEIAQRGGRCVPGADIPHGRRQRELRAGGRTFFIDDSIRRCQVRTPAGNRTAATGERNAHDGSNGSAGDGHDDRLRAALRVHDHAPKEGRLGNVNKPIQAIMALIRILFADRIRLGGTAWGGAQGAAICITSVRLIPRVVCTHVKWTGSPRHSSFGPELL